MSQPISPGSRAEGLVDTTLRIVTWNLWWRFGDWSARAPLIAAALAACDADVVALQEVWDDGAGNQAARLASGLSLEHAFEPVLAIDGVDWGMAVLSRWPLAGVEGLALPSMPSPDGSRDCRAMAARVMGPRGAIDVVCTHLSWRPEEGALRQRQVGAIAEFIAARRGNGFPPLVCGDFNAVPTADEIRMMTGEAAVPVDGLFFFDAWRGAGNDAPGYTWDNVNPLTHKALQPSRRLDYVFVGEPAADGAGHVIEAGLIGAEATKGLYPSDHFGVATTLRY